MITEVVLILPLYAIIFAIFFRCRPIIKAMTDVSEMFADLMVNEEAVDKRGFFLEKIQNGDKRFQMLKLCGLHSD